MCVTIELVGTRLAGDLITTGAWIVIPIAVGDAIEVEFCTIGMASVSIG